MPMRSDPPRDARYDAVIFDLFGTLVDNFPEGTHEATLTRMVACLSLETPQQAAFRRVWNHDTWPLRATGHLPTTEANIRYVCAAVGALPAAESWTRPLPWRFDVQPACPRGTLMS